MGDNYKIEDLNISYVDFGQTDIFEEVTLTQYELVEQDLRSKHPELQKAYDNYPKTTKKIRFREKITQIRLTVL